MNDQTPLLRNLVLNRAVADGCPEEVTKEAWAALDARYTAEFGIDDGLAAEMLDTVPQDAFAHAVAYGYTAGRVARWDALVRGSATLTDAIEAAVREFFHDEPFSSHDGVHDCPDCPQVAILAADTATAFLGALLRERGLPQGAAVLEGATAVVHTDPAEAPDPLADYGDGGAYFDDVLYPDPIPLTDAGELPAGWPADDATVMLPKFSEGEFRLAGPND